MSNLVKHARAEFEKLGWPGDDDMQNLICEQIIELLEIFSEHGHSGSSAPYALNLFNRLANFDPISPLTGEDDEWNDVSEMSGHPYWQNKRSSDIFKGEDGQANWSGGRVFRGPNGHCFTSKGSSVDIQFPWTKPAEPEYVDVDHNGEPIAKAG